jgi:hypothetical protein
MMVVVASIGLAAACGHKDRLPTMTSSLPETTKVEGNTVSQPQTVTPVGPQDGAGWKASFFTGAGWQVTNTSGIGQSYRAYTTSFDNQNAETAYRESGTVPDGVTWAGTFNATCVQLDLTQDGPGGRPFAFAYFDKNGKEFDPHYGTGLADCRKGTPTPPPCRGEQCEPTPQPTPTPTPEPTPSPSPTPTPSPSPSPSPDPALCYYKISKGSEADKEKQCEATNIGTQQLPIFGVWLNFDYVDPSLQNHCRFPLPGISDKDFQLTPGKSDESCLDKHDDK